MPTLNELVTFEYGIAYDSAYTLTKKALFTTPKIYSGKGDLSKRWYVYFYYRNKETGRLKLVTPIYGMANKYKTKEDRMTILTGHRKILLKLLKLGYNPFEDNVDLYNKLNNKEQQKQEVSTPSPIPEPKQEAITQEELGMEFSKAMEFVLNQKIKQISDSGKCTFVNRIKDFKIWVKETHPNLKSITAIN